MSKKTATAQQEPVKTADPVVDPSEDELFTNVLMKFFPRRLGAYTVIHHTFKSVCFPNGEHSLNTNSRNSSCVFVCLYVCRYLKRNTRR
jgi:hypothetical protein